MTGEQHERAAEAGARALCEYGVLTVDGEVATWERHQRKLTQMAQVVLNGASLREQGVRLVEQPKCPDCEGTGRYRDPRIWGTMPGSVACGICNGTGYARLVDLREVVEYVREWQDDWNEGAMVPPPADAIERRFGGYERSEWDGD